MSAAHACFGLMARFADADALLRAARDARANYRALEAYSPFHVDGLAETLGFTRDGVRWFALAGGIFGGIAGYLMQYYSAVIDYPLNIGGRPLNSWPAFLPIAFLLTLLGTGIGAAAGMLILNRLPQLYHPAFNLPEFSTASSDGFFLLVRADDPAFDLDGARTLLRNAGAISIDEVAP